MTRYTRYLSERRYQIALCLSISIIFVLIEAAHPFFFMQDDNRDQNLPYYVACYRAVINGEFPLFNFHQFLGVPLLSCIQSAAFYPANYLAVFLSKTIWGNYFATMELISFFHLNLAGVGFYLFARFMGLDEKASFVGSIAWAFCAFVISAGNSWIQIVGYAAYLPWLSLLSTRLYRHPDVATTTKLVLVRVLTFFLGHPQFFLYSATFEIIVLLLHHVTREGKVGGGAGNGNRFMRYYLLHYVCVCFLVLPILLPGYHQVTISAERKNVYGFEKYSEFSYNIIDWFHGLINPFASSGVDHGWTNLFFLSHIGIVTVIFVSYALVAGVHRRSKPVVIYVAMSILTLLFACNLGVAKLFYLLPIYGKFRWPFKVAFFTSYYLIIIASFGADAFFEKLKTVRRQAWARGVSVAILCVHLLNFVFIYAFLPQKAFGTHLDRVPYDEPLKNLMDSGRIVTVKSTPPRGLALHEYTAPFLSFDYATLWGLNHFGGYEVLVPEANAQACLGLNYQSCLDIDNAPVANQKATVDYLRQWGVEWYVADKAPRAYLTEMDLVYSDGIRNVYHDKSAYPLVFLANNFSGAGFDAKNVTYRFETNSIHIKADAPVDDELCVNILYSKYFKAYIDGKESFVQKLRGSRVAIFVPKGKHQITLVYSDPYFTWGLIVSILFLVVATPVMLKTMATRQTRGPD